MDNPYDSYDCHYCEAKGCMCPGPLGKHTDDCQPCGPCEATGQLSREELNQMARDYKADEQFKRSWKSAMIVLLCVRMVLEFMTP